MPGPSIHLSGMGNAARLVGLGGDVTVDQGRLILRGDFVLEICQAPSSPVAFGASGNLAIVVAEGADYRLLESSTLDFVWPAEIRLGDHSDTRAPWLRFRAARLRQVAGIATAMVGLDGLAVSLIGDGADPGDDLLLFPYRRGKDTRRLTRPLHPDFPSAAGYFLYPLDAGMGVMLGRVSTRTNISHAEAHEVVLAQNKASFWFKLSEDHRGPSSFLARSSAPHGISLTASAPGAGGVLTAVTPGAARWSSVDLPIEDLVSIGGRLRVAKDAVARTKGFTAGQIWLARATQNTPIGDATGVFMPTDRLELDLELPLEADIVQRLPEMSLTYRDSGFGSRAVARYDRFYGVRVAGLSDRSGGAVALDADVAVFVLTGTHASPSLHLKAGIRAGSILTPKLAQGSDERRLEVAAGDLAVAVSGLAVPTVTDLQLDTQQSLFTLISPTLVAAPAGVTSGGSGRGQAGYKRWSLRPHGQDTSLQLNMTAAGLRAAGDWVSRFKTADPTQTYAAIDHPGLGLTMDGATHASLAKRGGGRSKRASPSLIPAARR